MKESKRAFSAPPADVGKIFLQRMELKSPLTIKNGSSVSMNQNNNNNENKYLPNRYNNRNVLKTNTLQPQPERVVRALSERPQNVVVVGGGYDTDTGVLGYNQQSMMYRNNYRKRNGGDTESLRVPLQARYDMNKRYMDQSGYDTDTGLINARKSLNERLINNTSHTSSTLRCSSNLEKDPLFMKNSSSKIDNLVNTNSSFKINSTNANTPTKQLFKQSSMEQPVKSEANKGNNIPMFHESSEQARVSNDEINKSAFHSISSSKIKTNKYERDNQQGYNVPIIKLVNNFLHF